MRPFFTVLGLFDPAIRRKLWVTLPLAASVALLEALGFALLYPLIAAIATPDILQEQGIIGSVYEQSGANSTNQFLAIIGTAVVTLLLVRIMLQALFLWWQTKILADAEADIVTRLFAGYQTRDYAFHSSRNSASLVYEVQSVAPIAVWRYVFPALILWTDVVVVGALVTTLVLIEPISALSAVAVLGLAGFAYVAAVGRDSRRIGGENLILQQETQRLLQEGLAGIKVMKILGRGRRIRERFTQTRIETAGHSRRLQFAGLLPRFVLEAALTIFLTLIVAVNLSRNSGPEALASLGLLAAGGFRLLPSFQRILTGVNTMQASSKVIEQLLTDFEEIENAPADEGDHEAGPVGFTSAIELRDVTFAYEGAELPALDGIDLAIRRGEFVGLVGPSGAGKSTMADLLLGLLHPTGGTISVDGTALAGPLIAGWRSIVGYVPQQTFIFDDTLERNIALGLEPHEIDSDRVIAAISAARLDTVVADLPDGIQTLLGESGSRLSGGQRQRVGLARALYDEPSVLVLDEATSSLDGVTEAAIADTIEELSESITVIVIAHRLATVKRCDRLVHLDEGRILSVGTFAELVNSDPDFRAQASAAGVLWKEDIEAAG